MSTKIAVIVGSTRPSRIGLNIANWFVETVQDTPDAEFTIVDLKEINLPFLDEQHRPEVAKYEKDHTKEWKALIDSFDAYVFVSSEYNAGYPAPLKNAIDYLYAEWTNKPAAIVSYGWGGGASASAQLRQVLERLKMRPTGVSPSLFFNGETFDENEQLKDAHASFDGNREEAKEAVAQLLELAQAK